MKILLSAFACTPEPRGIEDAIGWNWAISLARAGRDLTVVTAAHNRDAIEAWRQSHREVTIDFRYAGAVGRGWFGNLLWQVAALFLLLRTGEWRDHDLIHHLTPGSIRRWSLLWLLPRPFVFGPASGAERAALRFVLPMGVAPVVQELLWRLLLRLSFIDPVFVAMQARAARILVVSPETTFNLWPRYRRKATGGIAIGAPPLRAQTGGRTALPVRVLFAAPLRYANGIDIFADVAAEIESRGRRYELIIVGAGPRQAVIDVKLSRIRHLNIRAAGKPTLDELTVLYRESDIAVFPSLRGSNGDAVLDAMMHGLPVVCLDLGVPPMLVGPSGEIVATAGKNQQDLCRDFADAIVRLAEDPQRRITYGFRARERAQTLTWDSAARAGYAAILASVAAP